MRKGSITVLVLSLALILTLPGVYGISSQAENRKNEGNGTEKNREEQPEAEDQGREKDQKENSEKDDRGSQKEKENQGKNEPPVKDDSDRNGDVNKGIEKKKHPSRSSNDMGPEEEEYDSEETTGSDHNGMDDENAGRPIPPWAQAHDTDRADKGIAFKYGKDTPSASIGPDTEEEDTPRGFAFSFASFSFTNCTSRLRLNGSSLIWSIEHKIIPNGTIVRYRSGSVWEGSGPGAGSSTSITMEFRYRWNGERSIDIVFRLEEPPGEGELTAMIGISSMGLKNGTRFEREGSANDYAYLTERGERLGSLKIRDADTVLSEGDTTQLEVQSNVSIIEDEGVLDISMLVPQGTSSVSTEGNFEVLEELVKELVDGAEEAANYIMDRLVSFAIGTISVTVIIAILIVLSFAKRTSTDGRELDLRRNRYYKKN